MRPPGARRADPIAEAAARARERLRHQREVALKGLDSLAAESEGEPGPDDSDIELEVIADRIIEPAAEEPAAPELADPEPLDAEPDSAPPQGDIAALREEVDALRRDLQEAVAQMSRDIERAERLAADRARKEARKQGRKSERAARRAARAAMDTPDDPT